MTPTATIEGRVESRLENEVATVTFSHPQSNSLPGIILEKLAAEITTVGANPQAKVIVLQSEGTGAFCAGASFDELMAINTFDDGKKFFSGFAMVINAMRQAPKFVIARIQGKAVGGGVGIAAAADYTLALDTAAVKLSELALGIGPFVVGPAVERKIGSAAFGQLSVDATEWKAAQWAKEKGLYANTFSFMEDLDKAVSLLANRLSTYNPEAMAELKKILWQGTDHWGDLLIQRAEISGRLVLSSFTRNAIAKFKAEKK